MQLARRELLDAAGEHEDGLAQVGLVADDHDGLTFAFGHDAHDVAVGARGEPFVDFGR